MNSNKARITYRLDPNRDPRSRDKEEREDEGKIIPLYQEEYRVVEEREAGGRGAEERQKPREIRDYQPLNQYTSDYGAWNSPYDAETQRIEELIRESQARTGRDREEPLDRAYRPIPEEALYDGQTGYFEKEPEYTYRREQEEWTGPIVTGPRYVRHNRPPWAKISLSVAGAAVTGVLLGFFVLSMFSGDGLTVPEGKQAEPKTVQATPQQESKPAGATVQKDTTGTGTAAASGKEAAFVYAGKAYTVLQYGSFAGVQGADQAKSELTKKGFAAASEQSGDKYFVYAGIATDRDHALALTQQLKDQKVDYYLKTYQVPAVSSIRWNGSTTSLKAYFDQSDKLLQSMNQLTLLHLEEAKPTAMDDSTLQSLKSAHTAWVQAASAVAQEAGEDSKSLLQRMTNAMNSAKTSLDEYKKNPSEAMLWNAQTFLMQFVLAEKELLDKVKVQ